MSIILSGLIHFFRPLLSSLSGVLECKGVAPWYFLTGLRIVAIFFSNGPWDSMKQDMACNWIAPMEEKSRDFCATLCQNQYFPVSVSATWGVVFLAVLLLVGLMRLTSPRKKKKKEDENENGNNNSNSSGNNNGRGVAMVATVPHGSSADISTVYMVGRRGLPRHYGPRGPRSYYARHFNHNVWHNRSDQDGIPMAHMSGGHGTNVGLGPYEAEQYGMPCHPGYIDTSEMPDHCYDMSQQTINPYPTDMQHTKMSTYCPETDQYGMSPIQSPKEQTNVASCFNETQYNNAPTNYVSVPMSSSSYKGKIPPRWSEDKNHEGLQQRYRGPKEYGDSTDYAYTMGRTYTGKGKMIPRYYEETKYSMATKCKTIPESHVDQMTVPPRLDDMNMAIKHRPVPGSKMRTKQQLTFDAPARSDVGFGSKIYPQPRMADDSNCRPTDKNKVMTGLGMVTGPTLSCHGDGACTCPENNPCHVGSSSPPQTDPGHCAESSYYRESIPGPQDDAKVIIANICGIPLFDIWVGLLLTSETCFLCAIILLQMPRLIGRSWICSPGAVSCPEAVECALKGRAEKRMALWGLAFTSILFIIACSGYFHLRFCWSRRCCRMCGESEGGRQGACAEGTEPEEHVFRGDVESGNDENKEEGL
ncbi:uncharacterized protein LOC103063470 [Python bivittatus]|uniref:Uncharacterized protein LOC103063470 n=1 Tax=Python bivittatus TaxID=176946 RepID=A0A9F5N1Q0_PYTBI|nr:uncharacterized protein LOC103063470 [Python bivittatus]